MTVCLFCCTNGQDIVTYGSYSYFIQHSSTDFAAAENGCSNLNGMLAVIHNETIYEILIDSIRNSSGEKIVIGTSVKIEAERNIPFLIYNVHATKKHKRVR